MRNMCEMQEKQAVVVWWTRRGLAMTFSVKKDWMCSNLIQLLLSSIFLNQIKNICPSHANSVPANKHAYN